MSDPRKSALLQTTMMLAAAMMLIVVGALTNLGLPSYFMMIAGIGLAIFSAIRYVMLMSRHDDQKR